MGFLTDIGWCDHTFNGWIGCAKISRGCRFCYAEAQERRWHPAGDGRRSADVWGRAAARRRTAVSNWNGPRRWNRLAAQAGRPDRVFGFSLGDVFEDHPQLPPIRDDFFGLVEETPWLRWMLLTKRIDLVAEMTKERWGADWPSNVWLGTSVEGQREANERMPILLDIDGPAERFVSAEPLLEATTIDDHLTWGRHPLSLLIVGGESGARARPMHPDWARGLINEAHRADVPRYFKQHGEYSPYQPADDRPPTLWVDYHTAAVVRDHADLTDNGYWAPMWRMGKTAAGRTLDGLTYDGVVRSWAKELELAA